MQNIMIQLPTKWNENIGRKIVTTGGKMKIYKDLTIL